MTTIPKITIFGSCRQYSIKDNFPITSIQERLTFPHYTKEIVQALEFCKGISPISKEDTKYCFRTCILEKRTLDFQEFTEQFNTTDLFVFEIASRVSYEWKGMYLHHIQTEDEYNFPYRSEIVVRDLTDEEIENDIKCMVELVYPRPVLVVSHIATYTSGKRYTLIQLLERICSKYSIPFYNPSILLQRYSPEQLFQPEKVLAHYSKFGESIISNVYKDMINTIYRKMNTLTLYKSNYPKQRIGSKNGDGGYVIAVLDTYDVLISCGISNDISFEEEFLKINPIPCLAFDGTISKLPENKENTIQFYKTNIGPENSPTTTNLHKEIEPFNNIFLKMDIETYEFRWLHTLSEAQLRKFKQIVIEFHFPFTIPTFTHLDVRIPVFEKMSVFETLSKTHTLIHFHCNNCCGTTTYENTNVPNVFECTYVRKDVQDKGELNTDSLPTELDRKNTNNADIFINHPPFVWKS
jgi:hypothetical protein